MIGRLHPLDRKLFRDLWRMRGQALAIALVIGSGIATLIMSFGALASLDETRDAFYERSRFSHVFATLKRAPVDVIEKAAHIAGVSQAEGRIVREVSLDVPGFSEPAIGRIVSLSRSPSTARPLNAVVLRNGRLPRAGKADEVLLSEAFAEAHGFTPGDTFRATLNGRKRALTVTGIALSPEYIYAIGRGQLVPDAETFGILWMDRTALEATFDLKGAFNELSLLLMRNADESAVIDAVDRLLEPYGGLGAQGRKDQTSHAYLSSELDQLTTIGTVIPPIFLAVAAFLLNMVLSRLIDTEREQIGLLKAFGYQNSEIGLHYGKLIVVITTLGVTFGVAGGLWLGRAMTELYAIYFRFPVLYFRFDPDILLIGIGVAYLAAGAGTWAAVRHATALPAAAAMSPRSPVRYSRNLLDRLGVVSALPVPEQIILRNVFRWPWRAGLTTLGIAASGGLLVTSFFFVDAVNRMTDVFFFEAQRQDATLLFSEALGPSALQDAKRMPAVLQAEGFRTVPVTLRFGHHSEIVALQGVHLESRLSRLLDSNLRPVTPPPDGIVLSRTLAELLHAEPGVKIIVDVKEGRRPHGALPLVAVTDEYVGLSAYMDHNALDRFLRAPPSFSGVHLSFDRQRESAFFAAVKDMPVAAGVTLKTKAVQSFKDTFARSMWTIITFYVSFGTIVTFGVVYNSARIALSERGRDLASLRVLGFTKGEVAYILLGELALLTIFSLPIGAVFGYSLSAIMTTAMDTKLFRIPLYIEPKTFGIGAGIVLVAAILSALAVGWRVSRLDLIAVLKTRE